MQGIGSPADENKNLTDYRESSGICKRLILYDRRQRMHDMHRHIIYISDLSF